MIYRSTDFRTNEFRGLAGGEEYEPREVNPMIGFRGAYRYIRDPDLFCLELQALEPGAADFGKLRLMIPFVRAGNELRACTRLIDGTGLTDQRDFQLWVMAEVPSVVYWLEEYARLGVVGASMGSNDLTQLVRRGPRQRGAVSALRRARPRRDRDDPRDHRGVPPLGPALVDLRSGAVGPSGVSRDVVRFGIDSISVTPDVIDQTCYNIAAADQRILVEASRQPARS